jgi:hypothetical protein
MLINAFWTDRVFPLATHQSCDLVGTEVLSQVTLNRHLNLRGKLPAFATLPKVLIGHLVGLFVTITPPSKAAMDLPTDHTPAAP